MQGNTREGRVERDPPSYYRRVSRRSLKPFVVHMAIGIMCLMVSGGKIATGDKAPAVSDQAQPSFLKDHWRLPIPPQGKPPITLQAGTTSHIPAGEVHNPRNTSASGPLKLLVFWVTEKGQPLTVPVK